MSEQAARRIGLYATAGAVVFTVVAPLLALAYFATAEGAGELATSTVAAWAQPARRLLGPLLSFASADRIYATYLQVMALVFPAIPLAALSTRSRRPRPLRAAERWGWRLALTGYIVAAAGVVSIAALLVVVAPANEVVELAFLALLLPGMLLSLIGSTVLGIGLLRGGHRPRLTGWLLAFALPLGIAGSVVLGHNSLGLVPLFVAWAATARRWVAPATTGAVTAPVTG